MSRLKDMWEFLTKFPALHRAIVSEFDSHNAQVAELQRQLEEAQKARRQAQDVSSELVESNRALRRQAIELGRQLGEMETVETVTIWANETFGEATIYAQIMRAKKEFNELLDLLVMSGGLDVDKRLAEEAADVCICLYRVIGTLDKDAINKKMAKNRARKWQLDGNGCAQHVRE